MWGSTDSTSYRCLEIRPTSNVVYLLTKLANPVSCESFNTGIVILSSIKACALFLSPPVSIQLYFSAISSAPISFLLFYLLCAALKRSLSSLTSSSFSARSLCFDSNYDCFTVTLPLRSFLSTFFSSSILSIFESYLKS